MTTIFSDENSDESIQDKLKISIIILIVLMYRCSIYFYWMYYLYLYCVSTRLNWMLRLWI